MRRGREQVSLWRVENADIARVFYVFAPTAPAAASRIAREFRADIWTLRVTAAGHWDATTGRLHLNEPTALVENWSGARP